MAYLTKSLFKIGTECPTKIYYQRNADKYYNKNVDDSFLESLAQGGFQVEALARAYHPDGILIAESTIDLAIEKTISLLQQDCILFEPVIRSENFQVRCDIIIKRGNTIDLIEVKAKSYEPLADIFINNAGRIRPQWEPYLLDVAFQTMVLQESFPELIIRPFLMLVDKSKTATVHGLNQKFKIIQDGKRFRVKVEENLTSAKLGDKILIKIPVDKEVEILLSQSFAVNDKKYDLKAFSELLATDISQNFKRFNGIGKHCSKCEFNVDKEDYQSGFKDCWKFHTGLTDAALSEPLLFQLWRGKLGPRDILTPLIQRSDYFLKNFVEDDYVQNAIRFEPGFSAMERRSIQIRKTTEKDNTPEYDTNFLTESFNSFIYPLHFIDFETTALAIPMYAGLHPYEQIAFQFSHHMVDENGKITHATEWLNDEVGAFPNFEFVRQLKKALSNDNGTIFRYHTHENTVLNKIYEQLDVSDAPDKVELCAFIREITNNTQTGHTGRRDMVDLYKLVLGGFYHISMKGSNSIKQVLPAIIECSTYLQEKYSKPCYGTEEIFSSNFEVYQWLEKDQHDKWINPYYRLPSIFDDIDSDALDEQFGDNSEIKDGGAAMMAYAKMQFTEMSEEERNLYRKALLRYCELDTLAMVMIYEGWKEHLSKNAID